MGARISMSILFCTLLLMHARWPVWMGRINLRLSFYFVLHVFSVPLGSPLAKLSEGAHRFFPPLRWGTFLNSSSAFLNTMRDDLVICEECVCCPDRGGTAIAPWALARIDWHVWDILSLFLLTLFLIICEPFDGGGSREWCSCSRTNEHWTAGWQN